jgi:type I restriction enzyme S subunit
MTQVPASWTLATLNDVCEYIQRGKSPRYIGNSELPIVNQKCVRWWGLDTRHLKFVDPKQWPDWGPERFLRAGDILWNSTGTGTIGRACLHKPVDGIPRLVVDSHITILRPKKGIDPRFVFYFIMAPVVQKKIGDMQTGSTNQVELPKSEICATPIPVAPAKEQLRIVSKIDELFSEIEEGERALERVQKLVERYRQSVLKAAVTGELTREWRETHKGQRESGEALLQRILKARREAWEDAELAKMKIKGKKPMNDNWRQGYREPVPPEAANLPEVPDGWTWASLDMLGDITGGITVDKKRSVVGCESVPYLRVANVQRGYLDLSEIKEITAPVEQIKELRLKSGDILFNEGGDLDKLGRGWIWEDQLPLCIHQNHVFRARLFIQGPWGKVISWYANVLGKQVFMDMGKQTTNLASLSLSKLKTFAVPVMAEFEADEIVSRTEDILSVISKQRDELDSQHSASASLRQSVLNVAFAGTLVDQDSAEEPASVLLERIAAARTKTDVAPKISRKKGVAA